MRASSAHVPYSNYNPVQAVGPEVPIAASSSGLQQPTSNTPFSQQPTFDTDRDGCFPGIPGVRVAAVEEDVQHSAGNITPQAANTISGGTEDVPMQQNSSSLEVHAVVEGDVAAGRSKVPENEKIKNS